uniref:Nephrocystin 3-like N-terminal domain-containing protein n=1 Tax=Psilocybe cubensis TaxID=181762 RepID=A0A8H7XX30_PSICU
MSFPNASNVLISGGTFIHTQPPATVSSCTYHERLHGLSAYLRLALALLSSKIATGASHNSAERFDPPKCHPNTREAIFQTILNWLDDSVKSPQIMWVYGSAGVGKSAIAQSIAEMCFHTGKLLGSFFFARGVPNRHTETLFIPTLAYQIMQYLPETRASVLDAVERDPQLFSLSLADQMEKLIIGPLNEIIHNDHDGQGLRSRTATLVVVDGLDECSHPQAQRLILDVLSSVVVKAPIPISVMVLCRPEQHIRETFHNDPLKSLTVSINLDNISDDTDIDIKTFLLSEFRTIKHNHPAKEHFPPIWPSENEMNQLLMRSQGHFIYASTIIKYVGSRRHSPITRLSHLLKQSIPKSDNPFASLDSLYRQILLGVEDFDTASKIIVTLVLGSSSLLPPTATSIESLHSFQPGTVKIALCDLHSIVYVPETPDENLRMYHASFSDFIFEEARSGRFYLDKGAAHIMLATSVLKLSISSRFSFFDS